MKLGISNIAWDFNQDKVYLALLQQAKFQTLEIAPTKIWPDVSQGTQDSCMSYRKLADNYGLSIDSMQSALFGTLNLNIFTSPGETIDYLKNILHICSWLGITKMVFGSPKNRFIPKTLSREIAHNQALTFFTKLAAEAGKHNVTICMEPNAREYGCNFLTNMEETVSFVEQINHPNFQVHLDTGVLILNHEDIDSAFSRASSHLRHIHISAPYLSEIVSQKSIFEKVALHVREVIYTGSIVIEMKQQSQNPQENYYIVEKSISLIQSIFSK